MNSRSLEASWEASTQITTRRMWNQNSPRIWPKRSNLLKYSMTLVVDQKGVLENERKRKISWRRGNFSKRTKEVRDRASPIKDKVDGGGKSHAQENPRAKAIKTRKINTKRLAKKIYVLIALSLGMQKLNALNWRLVVVSMMPRRKENLLGRSKPYNGYLWIRQSSQK